MQIDWRLIELIDCRSKQSNFRNGFS